MSLFASNLKEIALTDPPLIMKAFGSMFDAQWIDEACQSAQQYTIRRRKLPVENVVWLILGMGLWRDIAIAEVARTVGLAQSGQRKLAKIASSSTVKARQRLGPKPMEQLFRTTAVFWSQDIESLERPWHGMRVFALDGTTLLVPDTQENRKSFGGPTNQHGPTGYPKVRLMVMLATGSHVVVDAAFAGYQGKGTGEQTLMRGMAARLPNDSILLFDRGLFNCVELWAHQIAGRNRHWLGRIKSSLTYETLKKLGEGDELVRFQVPSKVRAKHPEMPEFLDARVLSGVDGEGKTFKLMTSMVDGEVYKQEQLHRLYGERWEVELGYRETKTYLLERSDPLRSKKPQGVEQELWGILLAYNLIRYRMAVAAHNSDVSPLALSFKNALFHIRTFCSALFWMSAPTKMAKLLEELDEVLASVLLSKRTKRKKRLYPRAVKARKKTYPIKRSPANG